MRFSEIRGNDELKASLVKMVEGNRLSHAILFVEDNGCDGLSFALALAQYVNCHERKDGDSCGECPSCHRFQKLVHQDLHFAFPVNNSSSKLSESEKKAPISDYFIKEFKTLLTDNPRFGEQDLYEALDIDGKSTNISVNEARRITEKLSLRAGEADYKAMVIYLPERMNIEAANKLLKLLEEPPQGTLFLLVSHHPELLLQTIRSRCQILRLKPLTRQEQAVWEVSSTDNAEFREIMVSLIDAALRGNLSDTFPQWEMLADLGREKQKDFCIFAEQYIRKIYLVASSAESLADLNPQEEASVRAFAQKLKPTFYEKAFKVLDESLQCIGSNVNPKLVFCDLCNQLMYYV